ncbi:MAG: HutD family protein [Bacteroidetes bacterium]|nr:HutD family protein [Bacteroidota bacterium]
MLITILQADDFVTSNWSGGSTTQLYISPANASYAERNFDFRISSAKVEVPESTFTVLPNVNRKLMVLEGEITLNHKNPVCTGTGEQHSKTLQKYEVDTFNGDWKTTAIGTCTDFNVMTTGNQTSELSHMQLLANHYKTLIVEENYHTVCLYLHSGSIYVEINNKLYNLKKESLLILSNINIFSFHLQAHKRSELIISKIGN